MNGYQATLAVHVLVAVLGLGPVAAVAAMVPAPAGPTPSPLHLIQLRRLVALASASLGLLIASGVLLVLFTQGLYTRMGWFRLSMVLVLLLGATLGMAGRWLRRVTPGADGSSAALVRVRIAVRIGCALAAAVVLLMVAKPW